MTDYSQYGEQAAILRHVRKLANEQHRPEDMGRFLDIGAWHPTQFSNSRALFEMGWTGVLIEPSPGPMQNLMNEYGSDDRVGLVQAAVTPAGGFVTMHMTDDAVSTHDLAEYEKWKDATTFRGRVTVPSISVADLFAQFGGFDFVNIDAEGCSASIFTTMLGLDILPPCVCVEHEGRTTELLVMANDKNYGLGLVNGTNLVLVRG
jgi:FkbM family methyltransferase